MWTVPIYIFFMRVFMVFCEILPRFTLKSVSPFLHYSCLFGMTSIYNLFVFKIRASHGKKLVLHFSVKLFTCRKTTSSTTEGPCIKVPSGDISLSPRRKCRPGEIPGVPGYRDVYWFNKPTNGHYNTPDASLSSFGHVIIHDKNH